MNYQNGCVCVCEGEGEDIKCFRAYLNCRVKQKTKTGVSEHKKKTIRKNPEQQQSHKTTTTQNNNNPTKICSFWSYVGL